MELVFKITIPISSPDQKNKKKKKVLSLVKWVKLNWNDQIKRNILMQLFSFKDNKKFLGPSGRK